MLVRRGAPLGISVLILVALALAPAGTACALSRNAQRLDLRGKALAITNNELRYVHGTWFKSTFSYETTVAPSYGATGSVVATQLVEVLPGRKTTVRAEASALYATGIALNKAYYRTNVVKIPPWDAMRRCVAWTNDLAISYDRDHWGGGWQSALWTTYMGMGAKQIWKRLPQVTRDLVARDVAAEANHLLKVPPPYYMDATGTILFPGDSKSEEDGWNASLLLFAAKEFPDNPHSLDWERQGRWYALLAYATPNQVGKDARIQGSNLNPDGTVVNHGRINPDYMFSMSEMLAKASINYARAGKPVPKEVRNNVGLVWSALTVKRFPVPAFRAPGGTIYRRGKNHTATSQMYYPVKPDWSSARRFNAAEMDVEAFALWADGRKPTPYQWARAHLDYTLRQQKRHSDLRTFSPGETSFPEDEQFVAASAAEMTYRLSSMR